MEPKELGNIVSILPLLVELLNLVRHWLLGDVNCFYIGLLDVQARGPAHQAEDI